MKIFIDSAGVEKIREAWGWGVIDGQTTNPLTDAGIDIFLKDWAKVPKTG